MNNELSKSDISATQTAGGTLEEINKRLSKKFFEWNVWGAPNTPDYFIDPPKPTDEAVIKSLGGRLSPKGADFILIHTYDDYSFMDFMAE